MGKKEIRIEPQSPMNYKANNLGKSLIARSVKDLLMSRITENKNVSSVNNFRFTDKLFVKSLKYTKKYNGSNIEFYGLLYSITYPI